jgi:hypothetical protein
MYFMMKETGASCRYINTSDWGEKNNVSFSRLCGGSLLMVVLFAFGSLLENKAQSPWTRGNWRNIHEENHSLTS